VWDPATGQYVEEELSLELLEQAMQATAVGAPEFPESGEGAGAANAFDGGNHPILEAQTLVRPRLSLAVSPVRPTPTANLNWVAGGYQAAAGNAAAAPELPHYVTPDVAAVHVLQEPILPSDSSTMPALASVGAVPLLGSQRASNDRDLGSISMLTTAWPVSHEDATHSRPGVTANTQLAMATSKASPAVEVLQTSACVPVCLSACLFV